jgi:hypothetical protein
MVYRLCWNRSWVLLASWAGWAFFVLDVPGWQVTCLLPVLAGLKQNFIVILALSLVSFVLPILFIIFSTRNHAKAFTTLRKLLPWFALASGVVEIVIMGQLVNLQGGAISPVVLPLAFVLNPCLASTAYLLLQEASLVGSGLNKASNYGRRLGLLVAVAVAIAALGDAGASAASLYWAPSGLSIQAAVFFGIAAIFFWHPPMEHADAEAVSDEMESARDASPAHVGRSFIGFTGAFAAVAAAMAISYLFSYFTSGYWNFAPDSAHVVVSYRY